MANFYDISNWQDKPYFQTTGTRSKTIVEHPETQDFYFFKTSIKNEGKDYKHEFWSEIVASEVGKALVYNTLKYDIAFNQPEIGCLSKRMNDDENEELFEGINYLQGFDPTYNPKTKASYDKYTFKFICNALTEYNLKNKIPDIINTIIFDSIIGNSDRHQENWGFIILSIINPDNNEVLPIEKNLVKETNSILSSEFVVGVLKFIGLVGDVVSKNTKTNESLEIISKYIESAKGRFSPIYDSGSCLGRELDDDKVSKMLKDKFMLEAFINRGTSEIRWDGPKISHFELIKNINEEYKEVVQAEVKRVISIFDEHKIVKIVNEIDHALPKELKGFELPANRKELMIKMITLRTEKLKQILE